MKGLRSQTKVNSHDGSRLNYHLNSRCSHMDESLYWPVGFRINNLQYFLISWNTLWIIITVPSHVIRDIISQSSYAPIRHRMTLDTRVIGEAGTGVPHILQKSLGITGHSVTVLNPGTVPWNRDVWSPYIKGGNPFGAEVVKTLLFCYSIWHLYIL